MNNKLLTKLVANSTVKTASILSESTFFSHQECVVTPVPTINLAFSGSFKGGFTSGITGLAGVSKTFKTASCLLAVKTYLDKYPQAVCIYYDSEFGAPPAYLEASGVDITRVIHTPVLHLEQLKFDITKQLESIERGDKVIFFLDSIGNLASKKEVDDAMAGKSVADMSRAKMAKSVFRIITPQLKIKDLPMFVIFHTYSSMDLFPTDIVSGGTGGMYAADTMIIVKKSQIKVGDEVVGSKFTYKIEKSRFVIEKSMIPIEVTYGEGISRFSGLYDIAMEAKRLVKVTDQKHSRVFVDSKTGEVTTEERTWKKKEMDCNEFWGPLLDCAVFNKWVEDNYKLSTGGLVEDDNTLTAPIVEDEEIVGQLT